jgi:acyl-CoA reductase-like NAD-dependent aldehyde dehydrogenase
MLHDHYPLYLGNQARPTENELVVTDKYTGRVATRVAMADAAVIDRAIHLAARAADSMAALKLERPIH